MIFDFHQKNDPTLFINSLKNYLHILRNILNNTGTCNHWPKFFTQFEIFFVLTINTQWLPAVPKILVSGTLDSLAKLFAHYGFLSCARPG